MNAKQLYKAAYQLPRLQLHIMEWDSYNNYPIGFDCPSRFHCSDMCQCIRDDMQAHFVDKLARERKEQIAQMNIPAHIAAAAGAHYFQYRDSHNKPLTCGLLQREANRTGMGAYPEAYRYRDNPKDRYIVHWRWRNWDSDWYRERRETVIDLVRAKLEERRRQRLTRVG